jgi:hypothetical protein
LLASGFITVKYQGGAYQKVKNVYGISDNWLLWKKGTVFERRAKESVGHGCAKPIRKAECEVVPLHGDENEPQAEHFQQQNRNHAK